MTIGYVVVKNDLVNYYTKEKSGTKAKGGERAIRQILNFSKC